MLGVEEPKNFRRASLVSEIYSEANDPLTAELTARGRRKKSSSVADFGKYLETSKPHLYPGLEIDGRLLYKLTYTRPHS